MHTQLKKVIQHCYKSTNQIKKVILNPYEKSFTLFDGATIIVLKFDLLKLILWQ